MGKPLVWQIGNKQRNTARVPILSADKIDFKTEHITKEW